MRINNILKKYVLAGLFLSVIFGIFFFTGSADAQTTPPPTCKNPLGCDIPWASLNKLNVAGGQAGVQTLTGRIIKTVMGVVGSLALIMFVAGGLMWMTAAGNSEKTAKAMRMIVWSSLGIVVIFSSYILVKFIFSAF